MTFTREDLLDRLEQDGCGWSSHTIRDLLGQEVTWRYDAEIVRLGRGCFRLRGDSDVDPGTALWTARDHALASMRHLSGEAPGRPVSAAEVREHLGDSGVVYCADAVRRALSKLRRRPRHWWLRWLAAGTCSRDRAALSGWVHCRGTGWGHRVGHENSPEPDAAPHEPRSGLSPVSRRDGPGWRWGRFRSGIRRRRLRWMRSLVYVCVGWWWRIWEFAALDLHLGLLDARGAWNAERALGAWTKTYPDSFFGLVRHVVRTQLAGPVPDPDLEGWLAAGLPDDALLELRWRTLNGLRYPAGRCVKASPRAAEPAVSVSRFDGVVLTWPEDLFDGFVLAYAKLEQVLERRSLVLPPVDR